MSEEMIQITNSLIESGMSERGGWSRKQIQALGLSWPPKAGWKDRVIGTMISAENLQLFLGSKKYIPTDHVPQEIKKPSKRKKFEAIQKKTLRARQAAEDFPEASALAAAHGMRLLKHQPHHYQLVHDQQDWFLNLWVTTGNTTYDWDHNPSPIIKLAEDWRLQDVVVAIIAELDKINAIEQEIQELDRQFAHTIEGDPF